MSYIIIPDRTTEDVNASADINQLMANDAALKTLADSKVSPSIVLDAGTDINTIVTSGFYRLGSSVTNGPGNVNSGQLIVSKGGDTILQLASAHDDNKYIYVRQASGIGTTPVWTAWTQIMTSSNVTTHANLLKAVSYNYVTASRALNTTYTNNTGMVMIAIISGSYQEGCGFQSYINGVESHYIGSGYGAQGGSIVLIIPAGYTYRITCASGSLYKWIEIY